MENREIKFRGQRVDNKDWVYGTGITDFLNIYPDVKNKTWIWSNYNWIEVLLETVGQFTGLKDSKRTKEYPKGQDIYECDTIQFEDGFTCKIYFDSGSFGYIGDHGFVALFETNLSIVIVI